MVCKSLALAPEDDADFVVLGTIPFGAFSGGVRLTLKLPLLFVCDVSCANPAALIPMTTTATANENLIFINPSIGP